MKAAIYLNEGTTQVVITPENEWERIALKMVNSSSNVASFWGGFYECQGGWMRETGGHYTEDSLMFRIEKKMDIPKL